MEKNIFRIQRLLLGLALIVAIGACSTDNTSQTATNSTKTAASDQSAATDGLASKPTKKTIVFFGNSLSAGYGLDPKQGFVGLIGQRIDSLELDYRVINAGNSGETTSGGNDRVGWILDNYDIDIFVLELGGNDALRGLPVAEAEKNLQSIMDQVKAKNSDTQILLAGMMAPPNMGNAYTTDFAAMYPRLAQKNGAVLIPFLLDQVGGVSSLNLPDGIHPNVEGHLIVRETVWKALEEML